MPFLLSQSLIAFNFSSSEDVTGPRFVDLCEPSLICLNRWKALMQCIIKTIDPLNCFFVIYDR